MGLSKRGKVSPGPLLSSLPEHVKPLAATLPAEDQEVLYHLALCNFFLPKSKNTAAKRQAHHASWHRSKSYIQKANNDIVGQSSGSPDCGYGYGGELPEVAKVLKGAGKITSKAPHMPVLGCSCFQCYLSFWSRWNASPNMRVIGDILDLVDAHVLDDPSWQCVLTGLARRKDKTLMSLGQKEEEVEISDKGIGEDDASMDCAAERTLTGNSDGMFYDDVGGPAVETTSSAEDANQGMHDFGTGGGGTTVDEPKCNRQMRGRGFITRIFPDVMGGLAERLWGLVSLRFRTRALDFD